MGRGEEKNVITQRLASDSSGACFAQRPPSPFSGLELAALGKAKISLGLN